MYSHSISRFVFAPPKVLLCPSSAAAVNLFTLQSKLLIILSNSSSSTSFSMIHQLCKTHALTMQAIFFSSVLTFSFSSLGNHCPSKPNALSITDLLEAKLVLNFFCANVIFEQILYDVSRWFNSGYVLSPNMWYVWSRR